MNVFLMGMKHCGKSTLGEALAARWGCVFYDTDAMVEARHERQSGVRQSVRELYRALGEGYFENLEGEVVGELHEALGGPGMTAVVALGGRTATNPRAQTVLPTLGLVVYLRVSVAELYARVLRSGLPPFLDPADPRGSFEATYRRREPAYERLAHMTVDLNNLDVDQALDALGRAIKEHSDGRQ